VVRPSGSPAGFRTDFFLYSGHLLSPDNFE
jgi:hypothetical protein